MGEISEAGDAHDSSPPANKENAGTSASEARKPPLMSLAMLKSAIGKKGVSSLDVDELSRVAYAGVLLKDEEQGEARNGEDQASSTKDGKKDRRGARSLRIGHEPEFCVPISLTSRSLMAALCFQGRPYTRKYWVHKELNKNCWMVLAKALSITWGDEGRNWTWPEVEERCDPDNKKVHVAELKTVSWLEIKGEFNTIRLSPWTTYKVEILVKMRSGSDGWERPVNLSLSLPDGTKQERTENLDILEKEKWFPISIGKFKMMPETIGKMRFSLAQTDGHWKSGLCVKAVQLMPTTEENKPPR